MTESTKKQTPTSDYVDVLLVLGFIRRLFPADIIEQGSLLVTAMAVFAVDAYMAREQLIETVGATYDTVIKGTTQTSIGEAQ